MDTEPTGYCLSCDVPLSFGRRFCSSFCRLRATSDNLRMPDPTPDEIAERVAEVQARWSEAERENHLANVAERNGGVVPWSLPVVSVSGGEMPGVTVEYVRAIETSTTVDSR